MPPAQPNLRTMPSFPSFPAFLSPSLLTPLKRKPLSSRHILAKCHLEPPKIPGGARLEPPPSCPSSIEARFSKIRFGYELPPSETPCFLRYRCPRGHVIRTRPNSLACQFCPTCVLEMSTPASDSRTRKLTLCQVSALAHSRNGRLLSTKYVNARTPLTWRCALGHVWNASVTNVRSSGSWCPECARRQRKLTIFEMRAMAAELGGECLSHDYISEHVKLTWRCAGGHEFQLAPNNIRRRSTAKRKPTWCKICAKEARAAKRLVVKLQQRKKKLIQVVR